MGRGNGKTSTGLGAENGGHVGADRLDSRGNTIPSWLDESVPYLQGSGYVPARAPICYPAVPASVPPGPPGMVQGPPCYPAVTASAPPAAPGVAQGPSFYHGPSAPT